MAWHETWRRGMRLSSTAHLPGQRTANRNGHTYASCRRVASVHVAVAESAQPTHRQIVIQVEPCNKYNCY